MNRKFKQASTGDPLWLFEENFRLLCELIELPFNEDVVLASSTGDDEEMLEVRVVERSRYTLAVSLRKSFSFTREWLPDLAMDVRLYFDAKVAEVVAYQHCRRLPAPYAVKDFVPFHRDERRQVNLLLNELLEYCLSQGFRSAVEPVA